MTAVALTLLFFGGMGIGIAAELGSTDGNPGRDGAILTALGVLFAIGGAWR